MGFIKANHPQVGDLLRVKRKQGYYHYAIAINEGEVVHFSGTNDDSITNYKDVKIRKASLDLFLRGGKLEIESPFNSVFTREEVKDRALSYIDNNLFEGKGYNLVNNNCEHFARYIYYGKSKSHQVDNALNIAVASLTTIGVGAATAMMIKKKKKKENNK